MKPDLKDYDTLDVTALKKAEIPIELCDGCVRYAMKKGLPRYQIAEFFLLQLETAIKLNLIDFILDNGDGFLQPEYFVHKDILNNWPEMDYPPITYDVAKYLKEREGQTIAPTPTPPELIRRRPPELIKRIMLARQKKTEPLDKPTPQLTANDSPATSTKLMLALAVKGLGFYDPNNERRGKQADAVRFFENQMEKEGLTNQYLKVSTLKDNLLKAMNTLKEHAILDIKDDT